MMWLSWLLQDWSDFSCNTSCCCTSSKVLWDRWASLLSVCFHTNQQRCSLYINHKSVLHIWGQSRGHRIHTWRARLQTKQFSLCWSHFSILIFHYIKLSILIWWWYRVNIHTIYSLLTEFTIYLIMYEVNILHVGALKISAKYVGTDTSHWLLLQIQS